MIRDNILIAQNILKKFDIMGLQLNQRREHERKKTKMLKKNYQSVTLLNFGFLTTALPNCNQSR